MNNNNIQFGFPQQQQPMAGLPNTANTPQTTEIDPIKATIGKLLSPFEGQGGVLGLGEVLANRGLGGLKNEWDNRIVQYTRGNPLDAVIEQYKQPQQAQVLGATTTRETTQQQPVISQGKPFEDMVFHESFDGNRGVPQFKVNGEWKYLDEVNFNPEPDKRITSLEIQDERDGHSVIITDKAGLAIANAIKATADAVAPEYTDYLLRLGWYEGRYDSKQRNQNKDKKTGEVKSTDRGIFQINDESFPDVPKSITDDPVRATLWAISLIESGKQHKWVADPYVKKAKTKITYE